MAIINTVADVFNVSKNEFNEIDNFVVKENYIEQDSESILIINDKDDIKESCKKIKSETINGSIILLQIKSAELYFLKYTGTQDVFLNSSGVHNNRIYLFAPGSTIKLPKGKPIYYSDITARYLEDLEFSKLSFSVENVEYKFKTGDLGIRDINFSVNHGKLIGIMGASGSGKTTLVNMLSGITKPSKGRLLINGIDLHKEQKELEQLLEKYLKMA